MGKITAWAKEHPAMAGAVALVAGVIFYMIFKGGGGSGGGGVAQLAQTQAAAQAQANQTNAQLSAQTEQVQAQLTAQEINAQAQTQAQQDQIAGQVIGEQLSLSPQLQGQQLQYQLLQEQITNQNNLATQLAPMAVNQIGKGGSLETAGLNELALLEGQQMQGLSNLPGGAGHSYQPGFSLSIPGFGSGSVSGL